MNFQPSIKSSTYNRKISSISDETEMVKIKQDYMIEYDEFVAYDTLIIIAEMTGLSNKNDIVQLLKDSMQEEKSLVHWYQEHTPKMLDDLWPNMINAQINRGQNFLLNHFGTKMSLVIMYVDMVDSTNISMTLSVEDLVLLIRAFTHEISNVVERYNGYVLKYVGDAVISFFPYGIHNNKQQVCKNSVECARSIIYAIKKEINLVLNKRHGYPEVLVKIGIDEGENAIIQYGYGRKMPIDILGYSMNVTSKITSLTAANSISIGENMYNLLDGESQSGFQVSRPVNNWKYIDRNTRKPYRRYELK
jgi:class 3 adenylate cyclase